MIVFGFTALLMGIAGWTWWLAWKRKDGTAATGSRNAWQDMVMAWLGPGSGFGGISLAALAGALTPGGPVVGFAIGAAALKAGAGLPQVMAFVTGWSLYTINRVLVWEIPTMPVRFVVIRMVISAPFPFVVAGLAWLVS
jgi:hypothetical protein